VNKQKILGVDFGSKRVGLAISDENQSVAFPLAVIPNTADLADIIEKVAIENAAHVIVVGESRDYKGEANQILKKTQELATELKKKGFTVIFEPEFMTSIQAERLQGKNDMIDASAAALILQSYLDKQRLEIRE